MVEGARPILAYSGPHHVQQSLRQILGPRFEVRCADPDPQSMARELETASVLLDASMQVRVTRAMIERAHHLRLVVTATTGADHIDQDALREQNIPLLTLKDQHGILENLTAAAEHSWLLLMACARRLCAARDHVVAGGWDRSLFPGIMLRGKTLGIIGCGRIGRWMACYGQAFGMTCQGYDPYLSQWPAGLKQTEFATLLASSDFVTIHVHLNEETRGIIDARCIGRLKPGCVFINTSRGNLVDEQALLEALRDNRVAAAGLDVLSGEPDIEQHPLRLYAAEHDNLIITPHIGGFSPDALDVVVRFSAERILQYFDQLVV